MKKILFVALSALFIGGVSSCKDYEDEIRADHKQDIAEVTTQHKQDVEKLNSYISALEAQLAEVKKQTETNASNIAANAAKIAEIEKEIDDLKAQVKALEESKADKVVVDSLYNDVVSYVLKEFARVDSVAAVNGIRLNTLSDSLKLVDAKVASALASLEALRKEVESLLGSTINGISVHSVTTPVLADLNINLAGIKNVLLCSYVGEHVKGGMFHGIDLDEQELVSEAGKIFLTVNPSNKDYTGMKLKLVSAYGEAPVYLSALQKSYFAPQVGISRAADKLTVYETQVNYPSAEEAMDGRMSFGDLETVAKDLKAVIKEHSKSGVKTLAADLFHIAAENSNVPAYAIMTEDGSYTGVADYAVSAFKPLGFYNQGLVDKVASYDFHKEIPGLGETIDKVYTPNSLSESKWVVNLDKVIDLINETITKVADRLEDVSPYLQPVMFVGAKERPSSEEIYRHLPTSEDKAIKISGNILRLVATTYTFDLLNPCYKKYLKIEKVGGSEITPKAYISQYGETVELGKPFNGSVREIDVDMTGQEKGVYKLTYDAVDFYGQKSGNGKAFEYYIELL